MLGFPSATPIYAHAVPIKMRYARCMLLGYTSVWLSGGTVDMDQLKVRRGGLIIPSDWLKGFGSRVSVERGANVIVIEPPARVAARKRLAQTITRLHRVAARMGTLSRQEVRAEVAAVRARRARRR